MEDLRSALQGSDARCLALEVALRRERSHTLHFTSGCTASVSPPKTFITFRQGKLVPTHRIKGQCSGTGGDRVKRVTRRWDIRDPLLRGLKLILSSRDRPWNSVSIWRRSCDGRTKRCTSYRGRRLHWGKRTLKSGWRLFLLLKFKMTGGCFNGRTDGLDKADKITPSLN